jgi:hypothetical protein
MALYVQIGLLILVLASFVIAFFSARTWHWGHVIVVLGIFLSTLGFFLLAAETLRIYAVLRSQVNQLEVDLENVQARNEALRRGTEDANLLAQMRNEEPPVLVDEDAESMPSLAQLDHELLLATRIRGRVWRNVAPAGLDQQTGTVRVALKSPASGLTSEKVVYVFEQGPTQAPAADGTPRGAQYLGEFRITQVEGQQAALAPAGPMDAWEVQRLASSRGPWVIYETMPVDRHEVFAAMSEEELKKLLPPQSLEDYLRHGQEAKQDDPVDRKIGLDADGNRLPPDQLDAASKVVYQRRLRDYATEFDEMVRRRVVMQADYVATQQDIERLTQTIDSAKKLQAFREDELRRLQHDLAGLQKERAAIEQHLAQLERQVDRARELLSETMRRNRELVEQLAARQLRAGRTISPTPTAGPLALDNVN